MVRRYQNTDSEVYFNILTGENNSLTLHTQIIVKIYQNIEGNFNALIEENNILSLDAQIIVRRYPNIEMHLNSLIGETIF